MNLFQVELPMTGAGATTGAVFTTTGAGLTTTGAGLTTGATLTTGAGATLTTGAGTTAGRGATLTTGATAGAATPVAPNPLTTPAAMAFLRSAPLKTATL